MHKIIDLYKEFNLERKENQRGILHLFTKENSIEINPDRKYPAMLIFPGGGYEYTSDRESEPIALEFFNRGFVTAYLEYTVKQIDDYLVVLKEAELALAYLKEHYEELNIRKDKIASIGFSAGGHLLGLLSTINIEEAKLIGYDHRPDYSIFAYPVISSDKDIAHCSSILTLNEKLNDERVSIDKRVDKDMPKSFVFTTLDDGIVPHENSLRLIKAFEDNHIEYEFHMFPKGIHGCSLADERVYKTRDVTPNMKLLREWVNLVSISLELYGFTTID